VRPARALRAQRRGLHRLAGARVPGVVPQYQDPGAAVSVRARLSAMMFLQFFIWGAWYTTIAVYMTHHGMETLTHWPYTVNPIAAIVAPFFLGLVADRYFATEKVLGVLHVLGGVYSFTLPHTPPPGAGQRVSLRSIAGLDALGQLGDRAFYVFIAASLLLCIPLAAYYNFTQLFLGNAGVTKIAATQTLGQMSETGFMLLMPLMFARLGVK